MDCLITKPFFPEGFLFFNHSNAIYRRIDKAESNGCQSATTGSPTKYNQL
jgi:hypothetical protein